MDAYNVVRDFEQALCDYTGAPYCVTVESCSAALFLCFKYCNVASCDPIIIPKITYPSVPCSIINAGGCVDFSDEDWQKNGFYVMEAKRINGSCDIIDSAKYLERLMWNKLISVEKQDMEEFTFVCLSFHAKKTLPIGRGGAILAGNKQAYEWFKCARFDGRHECALDKDTLAMAGWNMYLEPEQAARGLQLMQWIKDVNIIPPDPYQDLSKYKFFTEANR